MPLLPNPISPLGHPDRTTCTALVPFADDSSAACFGSPSRCLKCKFGSIGYLLSYVLVTMGAMACGRRWATKDCSSSKLLCSEYGTLLSSVLACSISAAEAGAATASVSSVDLESVHSLSMIAVDLDHSLHDVWHFLISGQAVAGQRRLQGFSASVYVHCTMSTMLYAVQSVVQQPVGVEKLPLQLCHLIVAEATV